MIQSRPIHILFASRLVYEKGIDILIDAIDQSISGDINSLGRIIWHVCSDGPYRNEILQRAKLFPERVIYHWILDQEELASQYRGVDFLFMPSRFLETFWLTALESLASGTPVIGFSKWWLLPLIPSKYTLDPDAPVKSLSLILKDAPDTSPQIINLTPYSRNKWNESLRKYFSPEWEILILHDYYDKIGWAEYYVSQVEEALLHDRYTVSRYGYSGKTTPWKRRFMFIFSFLAFWRGCSLLLILRKHKPSAIWMHSIQRYIWFWWVFFAMQYARKNSDVKVYLSHHDLGLMVPFPQDITQENQIPLNSSAWNFIIGLSPMKKLLALGKWIILYFLRLNFPKNLEHIIFAPFLEKHIHAHFPGSTVHIFPHSFDDNIFYQKNTNPSHITKLP